MKNILLIHIIICICKGGCNLKTTKPFRRMRIWLCEYISKPNSGWKGDKGGWMGVGYNDFNRLVLLPRWWLHNLEDTLKKKTFFRFLSRFLRSCLQSFHVVQINMSKKDFCLQNSIWVFKNAKFQAEKVVQNGKKVVSWNSLFIYVHSFYFWSHIGYL